MDCIVHGVAKSSTQLRDFHTYIEFKRLKFSSSYWTLLPALKNKPLLFYFIFFGHVACRISVSQPGIEPTPSALGVWGFNHWTAREVQVCPMFNHTFQRLIIRSIKWTWQPIDMISVIQFSCSVL